MYLMFADEADHDDRPRARHFIYGAVFISAERANHLSNDVAAIRSGYGFPPDASLKFHNRSRPESVSREAHRDAKQAVLDAAAQHGVIFCAYVMPHAIARAGDSDTLVRFGANTLLERFNRFCGERDEFGLVMFDRMPVTHEFAFYAEKFTIGLTFPTRQTPLTNILSYASTADRCSHFSSVADILVGAFRYCVNEEERDVAGRAMFPQLVRMMWAKESGGRRHVRELGVCFRPGTITHQQHRADRDELIRRLNSYLQPTA